MSLACEVTKKHKEEMQAPPREGACIHGLFMEGARLFFVPNPSYELPSEHCFTVEPIRLSYRYDLLLYPLSAFLLITEGYSAKKAESG